VTPTAQEAPPSTSTLASKALLRSKGAQFEAELLTATETGARVLTDNVLLPGQVVQFRRSDGDGTFQACEVISIISGTGGAYEIGLRLQR